MEAIGQLTGGVAHDFNNLLMAVLGSLELIRKRLPDDPKLLTLLENAIEGAQRGAVLTKRMLALSKRIPRPPIAGMTQRPGKDKRKPYFRPVLIFTSVNSTSAPLRKRRPFSLSCRWKSGASKRTRSL